MGGGMSAVPATSHTTSLRRPRSMATMAQRCGPGVMGEKTTGILRDCPGRSVREERRSQKAEVGGAEAAVAAAVAAPAAGAAAGAAALCARFM